MARPQKRTVDYFPHYVNHGKTLLILQNEFGNDGYAFWFQLLSLLCKTDGQVYDYNNPASWKLLLAETHVNEVTATQILKILSDIDAIDKDLHSNKIIWVQNLVDNLDDVYRRRRNGSTPEKPVIVNNNPVNVNRNTQTKLNQTKPNQTKPNNIHIPEYPNVKLTKEEYDKLKEQFGEAGAKDRIENLSLYIASKGDKYKNHYATILNWERRDRKDNGTYKEPPRKTTDEQRLASLEPRHREANS